MSSVTFRMPEQYLIRDEYVSSLISLVQALSGAFMVLTDIQFTIVIGIQ